MSYLTNIAKRLKNIGEASAAGIAFNLGVDAVDWGAEKVWRFHHQTQFDRAKTVRLKRTIARNYNKHGPGSLRAVIAYGNSLKAGRSFGRNLLSWRRNRGKRRRGRGAGSRRAAVVG